MVIVQDSEPYSMTDSTVATNSFRFKQQFMSDLQIFLRLWSALHAFACLAFMSLSVDDIHPPRYLKSDTTFSRVPSSAKMLTMSLFSLMTCVFLALRWSPILLHSHSTALSSCCALLAVSDTRAMSSAKSRSVTTFAGIRRDGRGVRVNPSS